MYIDVDTVVLRSLVPLFDTLDEIEITGADWRPQQYPQYWAPIGIGVLGPMRPELPFMRAARERQSEILRKKKSLLVTGGAYPFGWSELSADVIVPAFLTHPPTARLQDGAETWFGLAGGPTWFGGNIGHALQTLEETGPLPDSELFTFANCLMPESLKRMPIEQVLEAPTVLAYLLRKALGQDHLCQPVQTGERSPV
jgi:hypothetical protein